MNTQQAVEQLFVQLSELAQQLAKLVTLLQQEQTALTQNDFAALETLAHDKETISAQIEQLEKQRHTLCGQLKIDSDFAGIKSYITGVSTKLLARLEQQWDKISTLGSQCASQNQVNGILVAHQQRHAQQALAILRGVTGNDEIYSATGSQQALDYQHSLGRV
jgi:flagellar biosynthesis/type III secretory pathway chaperone